MSRRGGARDPDRSEPPQPHVMATGRRSVAAGRDARGNAIGNHSNVVNIDTFVLELPADPGRARFLPSPLVTGLTVRPMLQDALVYAILTASPGGLLALDGFPGAGKSSLTALACRDPRIVEHFESRIVWLTVGQSRVGPDLAEYLGDVCELLGRPRPATSDPLLAGAALGEVLDDVGNVLLVIDDVWSSEQTEPFLRGGASSVRVFTARSTGLVPGATPIGVSAMTRGEARETLMRDVPPGHDSLAEELVKIADGWPLVLGLLNAALRNVIRSGLARAEVEAWVVHIAQHPGSYSVGGATSSTFARAVEASIRLLPEDARRLCLELGIFRDDVPVPAAAVKSLWARTGGLRDEAALALMFRLIDLRLVEPVSIEGVTCLSLHDLMRGYFRDTLGSTALTKANQELVDAWRDELLGDDTAAWWTVDEAQAFVIEHLPWHLRSADRSDELEILATDLRWIETQVRSLGSAVPCIATLKACTGSFAVPLADFLKANLHVLRPDARPVLASTLLGRVGQHEGLEELANRRQENLDEPAALPAWRLPDLRLRDALQHYGPIGDCAVSPDGQLLATASDDGLVLIWKAGTMLPVQSLGGHRYRARACSFSPSGEYLASTGMDGTLRLWHVGTGRQERVLGDRRGRMLGVGWSANGSQVATVDTLGRVTVWDAASGTAVTQVEVPGVPMWSCLFAAGDTEVVACGEDGVLRSWDIADGTPRSALPVHAARLRCVTASPDMKSLAVAGNDGFVALVDAGALRGDRPLPHRVLSGHDRRVRWCAFSPDGALLASAGEDRTVRIWDVASGNEKHLLTGHTDWVGGCVFDPPGSVLFTCSGDGSVRTWDVSNGASLSLTVGPVVATESCVVLPEGEVLIGRADGDMEVLRASDGESLARWHAHQGRIFGVAATRNGLVSGGADGRIRTWTGEGRMILEVNADADHRVMQVAASGTRVGFVMEGREVGLFSTDLPEVSRVLRAHEGHVLGCAFSSDGKVFASAGDDGSLGLWDATSLGLQCRLKIEQDAALWSVDFAPNDLMLVASGEPNGVVATWDLSTGNEASFEAGGGRVSSCAIDPSNTWVASCSEDGLLAVWDLRSRALVTGTRVAAPLRRVTWVPGEAGSAVIAAGSAGTYRFELLIPSLDDAVEAQISSARL